MTIRHATLEDAPRVIEMASRFLRESVYGRFIGGATRESLARLFDRVAELGAIFVAQRDCGLLVGFIAVAALEHPISGEPYADEIAWWVDPDHRASGAGVLLLSHAEAWARGCGLRALKVVAPVGSDLGEVYERMGYERVESAYQKTLKPVGVPAPDDVRDVSGAVMDGP